MINFPSPAVAKDESKRWEVINMPLIAMILNRVNMEQDPAYYFIGEMMKKILPQSNEILQHPRLMAFPLVESDTPWGNW